MTLDLILDMLDRFHQRATYAAVADLLGTPHRSLMQDSPKNKRHSWIVAKSSGLPTGYPRSAIHPELKSRPRILDTTADLVAWLRDPS
jgi:hypothetical protein